MNGIQPAKAALDKIIQKSRVHLYKPIQIAEILYHDRIEPGTIDTSNLETYRRVSKYWRDNISQRLIGNVCTSSSKFQDNIFEENAMPPRLLNVLSTYNRENGGIIEAYIYVQLKNRLKDVKDAFTYLKSNTVDSFNLHNFLNYFEERPGLRKSVDKAYEISVYALFSTIVRYLNIQVTLDIKNPNPELINDFKEF